MKLVMNETRKNVLKALEGAESPMTLNELATALGMEKVNSGTVTPLVTAGVLRVAGKKKVAVVAYREVNTYELGDLTALEADVKETE